MATLSISLSGSGVVNGSKNYTVSDADIQRVLDWAKVAFASSLPTNPTNGQVLTAWVQSWVNGTKDAVQVQGRQTTVPTPIDIT